MFVARILVNSMGEEQQFAIEEYKCLSMRGYEGLKIESICEWYYLRLGKEKEKSRLQREAIVEISVLALKIIVTNTLFFEYLSNFELIMAFKESVGAAIEMQVPLLLLLLLMISMDSKPRIS